MRTLRPANERGHVRTGWLNARHSFSFGNYYDPDWVQFGPLRVINEDRVAPGRGFPTHPHANMEILTYVIDGVLGHKDSMGSEGEVTAGEMQYMSAGAGVQHSEYNHSKAEELHLLQIWIQPNVSNAAPRYAQRRLDREDRINAWAALASPDGRDGSMEIRQDAQLLGALVQDGATVNRGLEPDRAYWLHVVQGEIDIDGQTLGSGDALGITREAGVLQIQGRGPEAELLLFDLPS